MRLKNRKKSAAAIKSMKVGTDELKDLIKGAVKEAMGEEDDTGDDGSDTAAALDGVTAEDMADIIEQAVDKANEKRKSRKDAGEEVGDLTADEVIQEAAEIIDAMTADEGMTMMKPILRARMTMRLTLMKRMTTKPLLRMMPSAASPLHSAVR
jgi:hypothetical protein